MTRPGRTARTALPARVRSVADVTPHMRAIELIGPDFARLRHRAGAHLVVRVPDGDRTARRVYSVWDRTPGSSALTIRVARHDAGGPGCVWARAVRPGDRVTVEPPRSKITLADSAAFHLFIGDETGAVPLLSMRAAAHRTAAARPAYGVFEAATPDDEMPGADGVPPLPWVHRGGAPAVASRVLLRAVQDLDLPAGTGTAYLAGEAETTRLIQRHLVEQRGWPRRSVLVQPQWATGRPGFGAGPD